MTSKRLTFVADENRRSKLLEDAKAAVTGNAGPENPFVVGANSDREDLVAVRQRMAGQFGNNGSGRIDSKGISQIGNKGTNSLTRVSVKFPESNDIGDQVSTAPVAEPLWLTVQDKKNRASGTSAQTQISDDWKSKLQNLRRREKHQAEDREAFRNLIFVTALGGNGIADKAKGGASGEGGVGGGVDEVIVGSAGGGEIRQPTNRNHRKSEKEIADEAIGSAATAATAATAAGEKCVNRNLVDEDLMAADVRPSGGSEQIVDMARKSAAPEARVTHLLPREQDLAQRKIRWSPSVFLENFKSPAFTLAFRDNVARSMTEMIKRYVNIQFTSSELANQRRLQGNLKLKKMMDVFDDARARTMASQAETGNGHHEFAVKRRQLQIAFEHLNTYVNQKDELVGNAHTVIDDEGVQVEKRMLQVDEKREELRRLQQRADSVKRKMRRLSPFVDYLNRVTQMEEHQTMFPNRLAIIHRVETLMIIRTEMIHLLEEQFREETVIREQFFQDRDFVNTIHDRSNDAIRRLNMKLDRLERRCTRWSDLIAKREGEECGKKAMKGQCIRAIEYMYETVASFKGTTINPDMPLMEKLNQVSRFIEYRLGVEKEVEHQQDEVKRKEERRKRRLLEAARKHHTKKHAT